MAASAIEAGRAFLKLLVDDTEFRKGLSDSEKTLNSFGKSLTSLGTKIGLAGAALTAPFAVAAKIFADTGSQLQDMSDRTGLSVKSLSELKYAAGQTGTSLEVVEKAARKMQKDGIDPNRIFEFAKQIAAIKDPTAQAQAAMERFGKSGTLLLPMLRDLEGLRDRAHELGLVMTPETARAADKFGDAMDDIKASVTALAVQVGAALAPALTSLAEALASSTATISKWVGENNKLVVSVAIAGPALIAVGAIVSGVGDAIIGITAAVKGLRIALNFLAKHPYAVLATAAIAGLLYLFGPTIEKWLSMADATDEATDASQRNAAAQKSAADAMSAGTKAIDERAAALEKLTALEKQGFDFIENRKALEKQVKAEQDVRRQARLGQIEEVLPDLKKQLGLVEGQIPGADAGFRKLLESQAAYLRAEIANQTAERDELTGEAAKRREEQARIDDEAKQQAQRFADDAARQQEQAVRAAEDARERQLSALKRAAEDIQSQFEAFGRATRGGTGGKFAEQIAGTSRGESREERMLKVSEEMRGYLREIKTLLQNGTGIVAGAA